MVDRPRGLVAEASVLVRAPPDRVWDSLTNPAMIKEYMFGAIVVSDWREGGPITWKGEWQGRAYEDRGVILRVEPGRMIRYTHFSPLTGLPDIPENYHAITVRLEREGPRTRVTLTQDNNDSEESRAHSEGNWKMMLGRLKALIEG